MKIKSFFFLSALFAVMFFQACSEDEDNGPSKPKIENFVVESEGGNEIKRGGQISYEAEVTSTSGARLDYYHVEIHDEPESGNEADEYKIIDASFTEHFEGLRNTHLHEHIDVSDTANIGSYHFHLMVVDKDGNTNSVEKRIEVVE